MRHQIPRFPSPEPATPKPRHGRPADSRLAEAPESGGQREGGRTEERAEEGHVHCTANSHPTSTPDAPPHLRKSTRARSDFLCTGALTPEQTARRAAGGRGTVPGAGGMTRRA